MSEGNKRVLCLVSGELDSPIAGYLMHKAGFEVDFVHFDAQPYNDGVLLYKTHRVFEIFKKNKFTQKLYVVKQGYLLDALLERTPSNMIIIIWRRFMMRIAERIALKYNYEFLCTGDSLGQVASQTIHNMYVIDRATSMHVLRPLLLWNKSDIIKKNHELGIYDITSIRSACVLGFPTKTKTKTNLKEVEVVEKHLDIDRLVSQYEDNLEIFE